MRTAGNSSVLPSLEVATARRGATLLTVALSTPVIAGIAALCVDFGRVQSAKMQLNAAIDAASRYGATGLATSTAATRAISAAGQNRFDGAAFGLTSGDVAVGSYNPTTRVFTVNGTPADAIRINITRASGRSVHTTLARLIGISSVHLTAETFAHDANLAASVARPPTGAVKGFVGINSMLLNGPLALRAWDSDTGTNLDTSVAWASAQTGSTPNLGANVNIQGELQTTGTPAMNGATITKGLTGSPGNLASRYPLPTVPAGTPNSGNYNGPAGASQTFPGGTYHFTSLQIPSGKTLNFSGPVTIYVSGSCTLNGTLNTFGNKPANMRVYSTGGAGVNVNAGAMPLCAEIYAPGGPVNLGSRTIYGSAIGGALNVNGTVNMYVDGRSSAAGFAAQPYAGPRIVAVRPALIN